MKEYYKNYCAGCGLCENGNYSKLEYLEDGFPYPANQSIEMKEFCDLVCPLSISSTKKTEMQLWGSYQNYYCGFACDDSIRFRSASGGILTDLCCYLLENSLVDGVIQTQADPDNLLETITVISTTKEEVINCSGSRYAVSIPLKNIGNLVENKKKYAFVGKPCDVVALRNYAKNNDAIRSNIVYYFSFFCAGTPSRNANQKMIDSLGCSIDQCKSFNYRGNGWPGFVTAVDFKGNEYKMDYESAWMKILGREIKNSCKFCVDSIGEMSDISCGDYWILDENNKPCFQENEGVSCVFSWTRIGSDLLNELKDKKIISLVKEDISKLKYVQPNHYYRRTTMLYRWLAMKVCFRQAPQFSFINLVQLAKNASLKQGLRCFKGTVVRIMKGRI